MLWERTYGGAGDDRAFYLTTAGNGFLIVGSSTSFKQGKTTAWVLRLDPNGNVLWNRTFLEEADSEMLRRLFDQYEAESEKLIRNRELAYPAYDLCLKCSHVFNLLDARGALSVAERTNYIARVRNLAKLVADLYVKKREGLGFPLMRRGPA
ncbi:MAG: glycine--tRNA ligase subunit alpha [candidate division WOR-3 bacterium]